MRMIRLTALPLVAAVALLSAPRAAEAQIGFAVHAAGATDLGGGDNFDDASFGLGARVGFTPPMMPLSFWGTVDYFFPDCDDCGYQNFALDANVELPVPMVAPYLTAGYVGRRIDPGLVGVDAETFHGFSAGAGVKLDFLAASAFLEARNEFFSEEDGDNQILVRLGVMF